MNNLRKALIALSVVGGIVAVVLTFLAKITVKIKLIGTEIVCDNVIWGCTSVTTNGSTQQLSDKINPISIGITGTILIVVGLLIALFVSLFFKKNKISKLIVAASSILIIVGGILFFFTKEGFISSYAAYWKTDVETITRVNEFSSITTSVAISILGISSGVILLISQLIPTNKARKK